MNRCIFSNIVQGRNVRNIQLNNRNNSEVDNLVIFIRTFIMVMLVRLITIDEKSVSMCNFLDVILYRCIIITAIIIKLYCSFMLHLSFHSCKLFSL